MKRPSLRQKSAKQREKSAGVSIAESAQIAIAELTSRARNDLAIARLTLGLFSAIWNCPSVALFRGYKWRMRDVTTFPARLRRHARNLVRLGQEGEVTWLLNLLEAQATIEGAVHKLRRSSPAGRRWRKIAARIRKQYPVSDGRNQPPPSEGPASWPADILPDLIGQPLTDRTIRMIEGFNPTFIEVLSDKEPSKPQSVPGCVRIQLQADGYSVGSIAFLIAVARPALRSKEIHGALGDFFETGTEGTLWALYDDENVGYDALKIIHEGDHLTIMDSLGDKVWSGTIRCDHKSGYRPYPMNPKLGQPCALGRWIHWTQRGFSPDKWARFFMRPEFDRMRGILIRKADRLVVKTGNRTAPQHTQDSLR